MKTLMLLRHAKSGWNDRVARDFDRPLNPKGRRAAQAMGRHLRQEGMGWDRVFASPAVRVVETVAGFERGWGDALDPAWDRRLYLAAAETLLDIVREADAAADRLLVIGHNPGLEDLTLLLAAADDGLRDGVEEKYPTAAFAELRFDIDRWADAGPGGATLARFVRPRDLDPSLGPDREG